MSDSKCPSKQLVSRTAFSFKSLVGEYNNLSSLLAPVKRTQSLSDTRQLANRESENAG